MDRACDGRRTNLNAPEGSRTFAGRLKAALARQPAYGALALAYPVLLATGIITAQWFHADEWDFIVRRNRPAWGDAGPTS